MGSCMSTSGPAVIVTASETAQHREVEKVLKVAKTEAERQVKVLLLGSGDSGKSTILKQMRIIHDLPWSANEIESYRQLVFDNLTRGLKSVLDALPDMGIELPESLQEKGWPKMIEDARDLRDGEAFPSDFREVLLGLWGDSVIQTAISRGNEAALPENLGYFFSHFDRLFDASYLPTKQDIVMTRARTIGITETVFKIQAKGGPAHEMLMVDVGGQKSERRKWIHCFQDVTSILFLVSLSGYDQCLVEDKDSNQMQDAMTMWDSICNSQWFKSTSIILFLNKHDLFKKRIAVSPINNFFPDYEGPLKNTSEGQTYFKKRFARLASKAGRAKGREVYIHITTATNTVMLRIVMSAVEDITLRGNLTSAGLI